MDRMETLRWWQEARFGLFIHWGLHTLTGRGEWAMYKGRIPAGEYSLLADHFSPSEFDAKKWVHLAKDAGMKYIVVTARHFDGFSLFKTKASPFNAADATPFGRDVLRELAQSCRRNGIRLGFCLTHARDWRHPLAQSLEAHGRAVALSNLGNFWDYPNENLKNLDQYIDEMDLPQLRELLTQYGDVLTIWFDAPSLIRPDQARRLLDTVRALQPGCLVSSGLSADVPTDYESLSLLALPSPGFTQPWEAVGPEAAMDWEETVLALAETVSCGGNLLVNVYPDAQGTIPGDAQFSLKKAGAWLKKNGEAIYGAGKSPFRSVPSWGRVTRRESVLYLIVTDPAAREITLTGLCTGISSCRALDGGTQLAFTQTSEDGLNRLTVRLTGQNGRFRVVKVELNGDIEIAERLVPDADGRITLPAACAEPLRAHADSGLRIGMGGVTEGWTDVRDQLQWTFFTGRTGRYLLRIVMKPGRWQQWDTGHAVNLELDEQLIGVRLCGGETASSDQREIATGAGDVWLAAGRHVLTIAPESLHTENGAGLTVARVELLPR